MQMWLEFRTALHVARLGTVTAAAEGLGIHRATVNRHIDALEAHLGTKLFQRHGRGYVLTDAGQEFLHVGQMADDLMSDFAGRTRSRSGHVTGQVILTASPALASLFMPAVTAFRAEHPDAQVMIRADDALARLEYGEAHIALRMGRKPTQPDYVAQRFRGLRFGLYAHDSYVARKGVPTGPEAFADHDFTLYTKSPHLGFEKWLVDHVPEDRFVVMGSHPKMCNEIVFSGAAIGFLPEPYAAHRTDLHTVVAPRASWSLPIWLVTHVDLHRTEKVQAMLTHIKALQGDS